MKKNKTQEKYHKDYRDRMTKRGWVYLGLWVPAAAKDRLKKYVSKLRKKA